MKEDFNFENLEAWKMGMMFLKEIYRILKIIPRKEESNLKNQLKRAAISFLLNIAEGSGRQSKKEFAQFLYQARGSLHEVVAIIKILKELRYVNEKETEPVIKQAKELKAIISGLIKYLKK